MANFQLPKNDMSIPIQIFTNATSWVSTRVLMTGVKIYSSFSDTHLGKILFLQTLFYRTEVNEGDLGAK